MAQQLTAVYVNNSPTPGLTALDIKIDAAQRFGVPSENVKLCYFTGPEPDAIPGDESVYTLAEQSMLVEVTQRDGNVSRYETTLVLREEEEEDEEEEGE